MVLVEQRKQYMEALQRLIDARQAEIDQKVEEYRLQLEQEKLTPEMSKLTTFIRQLDEMIAYERSDSAVPETSAAENIVYATPEEVPVSDEVEDAAFPESENEAEEISGDKCENANGLDGTGFEALAEDIADTRAKLRAAEQGRPGMPNVVLPRRQ